MITTTYICDKCKQSKSKEEIYPIEAYYTISRPNYTQQRVTAKKDICKQCLESLGLLTEQPTLDTDNIIDRNRQKLEDKLIDILTDLGVLFEH